MALCLVMMAGLPGTGKSTVARGIGEKLGWLVLDKDVIHTHLLKAGVVSEQAPKAAYQMVLGLAEDVLVAQKQSLILDTIGRHPVFLEQAQGIVQKRGATFRVIWCRAPLAVREERLQNRAPLPSQWKNDQTNAGDEEKWFGYLPDDTLVLDTTQPLEQAIQQAVAYILS